MRRPTARAWLLLVTVVVLGAGTAGLLLTARHEPESSVGSRVVTGAVVRVPVEGMTCAVCVSRVKKALESVDGVLEAKVDLERREARVRYAEGQVSPETLVVTINHLGYKAGTPVSEVP